MGKAFWGSVGAVLAAVTAVVGSISAFSDVESPDTNVAKSLLGTYYPTAPRHPQQTWDRLTPGYRATLRNDAQNPVRYPDYARYYRQFASIDVDDVGLSEHRSTWFSARITYHWDGRPPSVSHQEFDLRCPWWTRYPIVGCTGDNARINATGFVPRRYWADEK